MKERPIIFNSKMVRAILDGTKTQTRRIMKNQIVEGSGWWSYPGSRPKAKTATGAHSSNVHPSKWHEGPFGMSSPVGRPGDRLWVKETFSFAPLEPESRDHYPELSDYVYFADHPSLSIKWKPSIHMPREASRILLEITNVRVERLNDISEEDAIAEGVENTYPDTKIMSTHSSFYEDILCFKNYKTNGWEQSMLFKARHSFQSLWESKYGAGAWYYNPWVWVVEFKRIDHE